MILLRTLLVLALSASSLASGAPVDSPERIARLGYVEGQISFRAEHEVATYTLPDRPLVPGDRLVTDAGGRAELALGNATARLDERTELAISTLDAKTVRVTLTQGTMSVHLRELYDDETFAIATPNTTLTLLETGEYRISVPTDGTTDVTVRGGLVDGVTAGGPVRVVAGQRVRFEGRQALANLVPPRSNDAFDEWVLEREVQLGELQPTTEQLATGDEYRELDQYGEWHDDSSYGRVWMPSYAYGGYDPFRYGHWQSHGLGYSWVGSMPWYYYTDNYGRWAYLHDRNRWCWVPSRRHRWVPSRDDDRVVGIPLGNGRPREGGKDRPAATPRRLDADQTPAWRDARDVAVIMPSRQAAEPTPRTNREQAQPQRSAPPPQNNTPTMQPSRPAEARREATSSPPSRNSREVGKIMPD